MKVSSALYALGFAFSLVGIFCEVAEKKHQEQSKIWTEADDNAAKEATTNARSD